MPSPKFLLIPLTPLKKVHFAKIHCSNFHKSYGNLVSLYTNKHVHFTLNFYHLCLLRLPVLWTGTSSNTRFYDLVFVVCFFSPKKYSVEVISKLFTLRKLKSHIKHTDAFQRRTTILDSTSKWLSKRYVSILLHNTTLQQ